MRVLADYHHHDLWESLELLCERLGFTLYRPIGMDWFDEEYWNFERAWHGDAIARQYLEPWGSDEPGRRWDPSHERWLNIVTLEEARDLKPDIVISSVDHNHGGFARFAKEVGAKFGLHLGNVRFGEIDMAHDRWDLADFGILTSLLPFPQLVRKPYVVVHQEFSLEDFRHEPPNVGDPIVIASFVNGFPENKEGYQQFRDVAALMPDYDWRIHGAYGSAPLDEYAAGNINRCADVGQAMRDSDIAWHTKQWSDGFGHVIHNWFAVGRPVVGFASYYNGGFTGFPQLAGALWVEGVTSFDISYKTPDEVRWLLGSLDAERIERMSAAAAARFREVVNFDEEAEQIRAMFAQVLP